MKTPAQFFPALAILTLLTAAIAYGGQYGPQDFQSYTSGTDNLGDGTEITSNDGISKIRGVTNRYLRLTRSGSGGTSSAFKIPDLDPAGTIRELDASFQLWMSTDNNPADGVAINFGPIPAGYGVGEGGFTMENGLTIGWDTYQNGGGDPTSIEVFANNVSLANFPQTFSNYNNRWVQVTIHWDENGLDLGYDGTALATDLALPGFEPGPGDRFAFSGRTGGATQNTYIDNLSLTTTVMVPILTGGPVITEFLASNEDTLEDDRVGTPDWIELYNGSESPAALAGHYLTDDSANPTLWQIPDVTIPPFGHLVIYASGEDRSDPPAWFHSNFSISKNGGYLALVAPDGTTVLSEFNYPSQVTDVSYGELGVARSVGFLETPTPGSPNSGLQADGPPAEDVAFDREGGLFSGTTSLAILPPLAAGAVVRYTTDQTIPDATSPVYNSATPFAINGTTTIRARVFEPGKLPGRPASRTLLKLAAGLESFNSALPIVVADSNGFDIDSASNPDAPRPFRPVYTAVIDTDPADGIARINGYAGFTGRGGMHVRGNSSTGFPKKQYAWETWDQHNRDKNVSILGMPAESDWILQAPYSDKTLMRNVITYQLARALHGDGGGMRTRFVELFLNHDGGDVTADDYQGVYVFMEKIKRDGDRVDIAKLNEYVTDPELVTGGYIFKKDKPPYAQPWNTATEGVPLDIHEPDALNNTQFAYLQSHINDFETALHGPGFADPATGYAAFIDPLSFIDNHLFVELFREIDGYRISQYFSKDRGGKIRALPVWDYNLAFGNANYLNGQNPVGWYFEDLGGTDYYWYPRLFQDPDFVLAYWDRFWQMRRGLFSNSALLTRINAIDTELDQANAGGQSAVTRNFDQWPVLGQYVWPNAAGYETRTTHQAEVNWMKTWLTTRLAWVEGESKGTNGPAMPPVWNQYGGPVDAPFLLTMSEPNGWTNSQIRFTTDGSDPRSPSAQTYSDPIPINEPVRILARVTDGNQWSPLSEGTFIVETVPAAAGNLAVSEIHYHPVDPTQAEINAGFTSAGDFEFLEITNIHPTSSVNLEGAAFIDGISFIFDASIPLDARILAPGARVVLAGNADAFPLRHPTGTTNLAGTFGGSLSNDGERIELIDALGQSILAFTYNDAPPWPAAPDGGGYSLTLRSPISVSNPDVSSDWRSSALPGGSPGNTDTQSFAGNPDADLDGDGRSAFLEFAQGTSDSDSSEFPATRLLFESHDPGTGPATHLVLEFATNLAADQVRLSIESSSNPGSWTDASAGFTHLSTTNLGDGSALVRYRSTLPFEHLPQDYQLYRVVFTSAP